MHLYTIVPLRHAVFNESGPATAALIMAMAAMGFGLGFIYEWKSVWCSGLCPVHPVEKLYGGNVIMPVPNLHCSACENCVIPCPDSTPNIQPGSYMKNTYQKICAIGITGGLPGFIWGWFHVPDASGLSNFSSLPEVYIMPWTGLFITLVIYLILTRTLPTAFEKKLNSVFAAAAVSCYYWFRIPSLFGFGIFAKDGLLLDLKTTIPGWTVYLVTTGFTLFFFYWLVIRKANRISWLIRPQYAAKQKNRRLSAQERV